jgi:hypothetical protein
LHNSDKAGAELNRSAVIDFFNGVVGEKVARQGALTAGKYFRPGMVFALLY